MLAIALELARENAVYEDIATKFFEHFLYIAGAMNDIGGEGISLWDEEDEFFYDVLPLPGRRASAAAGALAGRPDPAARRRDDRRRDLLERTAGLQDGGLEWFLEQPARPRQPRLALAGAGHAASRRLLALVRGHRMKRLLKRMLDPKRVPQRLRRPLAVSRYHRDIPSRCTWTAMDTPSATSRASRPAACSAATRTGAARSGSRSTIC